jgi:hypothetical protein
VSEPNRGIAILHYDRLEHLKEIITAIKETAPSNARVVVCDDGTKGRFKLEGTTLLSGPNSGVATNKNRALWLLQDCHFLCLIEDDLKPTTKGWFEDYEKAVLLSGIHHFCRVQDKLVEEQVPEFTNFMRANDLTPIYASSPRGDLTFLTQTVVKKVGAFNPLFIGAGYSHGEWSERVAKAGLINHPNKWVDIQECRDKFVQIGDTEGGRWKLSQDNIKKQLKRNAAVLKELNQHNYIYHPLVLK